MLIVVDANSGVPVYRQIVEQVRFLVVSGRLSGGEELPSTRSLSEALGLNPMTVSKAYGLLEQEGLLERRPGLPLVVRELDAESGIGARAHQFRQLLGPVATAARQLGLSDSEALDALRAALAQHAHQEHDR